MTIFSYKSSYKEHCIELWQVTHFLNLSHLIANLLKKLNSTYELGKIFCGAMAKSSKGLLVRTFEPQPVIEETVRQLPDNQRILLGAAQYRGSAYPEAPGLILRIPENFFLILLRLIDDTA